MSGKPDPRGFPRDTFHLRGRAAGPTKGPPPLILAQTSCVRPCRSKPGKKSWNFLRRRFPQDVMVDIELSADQSDSRRHRIRQLSLFGSTLKGAARPDSDIDLLVEFEPQAKPGLLALAGIELELSSLLNGRKVDLRTAQDLSRAIEIIGEAASKVSLETRAAASSARWPAIIAVRLDRARRAASAAKG